MAKKKELPPQVPKDPLQRIALCMSGGGYRAAAFQLGMMSYLHYKSFDNETLLKKVKAISTVSGGTIIGVYYAAMVQEGKSFKEIYTRFVAWISTTDLVKASLEKVSPNGKWRYDYKRKNIINAFAELYDESLLNHQTMKVFSNMNKSHLEFVCFNATEFLKGYRFRFQTFKGCGVFGSDTIKLKKIQHEKFRLGDIMAASSGFSGGFEPIAMPDDFLDPTTKEHASIAKKTGKLKNIGLMDGGIHDNQGISSIESYQSYTNVQDFDLIMFSDVSSPYLDPFIYTDLREGGIREKTLNNIGRQIKGYKILGYVLTVIVVVIGIWMVSQSESNQSSLYGAGITTVIFGSIGVLIWLTITLIVKNKWGKLLEIVTDNIPKFFKERLSAFDLLNMKLKHLEVLAMDRLNSLKMLVPDVFLKQIRRLHYNRIFEDDNYHYRRSACLIKELTEIDYKKRTREPDKKTGDMGDYTFMRKYNLGFQGNNQKEVIGEKILKYTTDAASVKTALWFTKKDDLDEKLKALIISGQVSCCQDLLIYLSRVIYTKKNGFAQLDSEKKKSLKALHKSLTEDWERFKKEPEFLYESLNNG